MKLIKWILSKFGYVHKSDIAKQIDFQPVLERKQFEIKNLRCVIAIDNIDMYSNLSRLSFDEKMLHLKKRAFQQFQDDILKSFVVIVVNGENGEKFEFQLKVIAPTNDYLEENLHQLNTKP